MPDQPTTPPDQPGAPAASINISVQPGPNGDPWVGLHFQFGTLISVLVIPPEMARAAADGLPAALTAAAQEADGQAQTAAAGKLITASADVLATLNRADRRRKGAS